VDRCKKETVEDEECRQSRVGLLCTISGEQMRLNRLSNACASTEYCYITPRLGRGRLMSSPRCGGA
jgi:hypothetical protein